MPKKLDADLSELKSKLVSMGDLAQDMFQSAVAALVDRDRKHIDGIEEQERQVDAYQIEIDDDVVRMMAVHGPVAMDLRVVFMVARINTELERIGDQACNLSEYVDLLLAEPELKKLVDIPRMATTAAEMVKKSLQSFSTGKTDLAREVIQADDIVDALNDQLFRELLTYMISDAGNIKRALALILFARSLERIADHATNIAEEVIYLVRGEDVRHPEVSDHD